MILIITCSFDGTVDYLEPKFHLPYFRLNVDQLDQYQLNVENDKLKIVHKNHIIISDNITSIYYRKPYLPNLTKFEPFYRGMIANDIMYVIKGIIDSIDCIKLTCPYILQKAENKILQYKIAKQVDFILPDTLYTNSQHAANVFVKNKTTVIKPISTGKITDEYNCELYNTSLIDSIEDDISITPIFLQSFVAKDYEVRVYFIKNLEYAVKIIAKNKIDWRLNEEENIYSLITLPKKIKDKCIKFMKLLDIEFGAFDFIVKDNEWVFLEINPNGQWLWLETQLNLHIGDKIVEILEGK